MAAKKLKRSVTIIALLVFGKIAMAQWFPTECVEELKINPFFPCPDFFSPVCACDGNTYQSPCSAENHGGITQGNYFSGVCGEFDCFISPNPTSQFLRLKIQFAESGSSATVYVIDLMGVIHFQRIYNVPNNLPLFDDLPVADLCTGLYFLLVQGSFMQRVFRFGKN